MKPEDSVPVKVQPRHLTHPHTTDPASSADTNRQHLLVNFLGSHIRRITCIPTSPQVVRITDFPKTFIGVSHKVVIPCYFPKDCCPSSCPGRRLGTHATCCASFRSCRREGPQGGWRPRLAAVRGRAGQGRTWGGGWCASYHHTFIRPSLLLHDASIRLSLLLHDTFTLDDKFTRPLLLYSIQSDNRRRRAVLNPDHTSKKGICVTNRSYRKFPALTR